MLTVTIARIVTTSVRKGFEPNWRLCSKSALCAMGYSAIDNEGTQGSKAGCQSKTCKKIQKGWGKIPAQLQAHAVSTKDGDTQTVMQEEGQVNKEQRKVIKAGQTITEEEKEQRRRRGWRSKAGNPTKLWESQSQKQNQWFQVRRWHWTCSLCSFCPFAC